MLPTELGEQLRGNALGRLRLHGGAVLGAMLRAELDVQQAQKVPHLGGRAHGGLAAAARQPLLDGDGGRNAVDRVHLGPPCRLHDAAGIGVERFQIAALAFVEQDVERERGLARAAHARHHIELAARNVHAQVLEVVFLRVDNFNGVFGRRRLMNMRKTL